MVVQLWALPQGNNIGALYRIEVLVVQSYLTLCDPLGYSPPSSSVHGILQARDWSRLLFPSPGDLPDPGIKPTSPALQADSLPSEPTRKDLIEVKPPTNGRWSNLHSTESGHGLIACRTRGFPGGASGKEPACQCKRGKRGRFNPWVGKIPWRRAWQSIPVFLPTVHRVAKSQTGLRWPETPHPHPTQGQIKECRPCTQPNLISNPTLEQMDIEWKWSFSVMSDSLWPYGL